ncbi:uncharacterized protein LOC127130456 [Lathyrus oleraceus]|uniref:uncharacterized protein LOC127130456 n=1 Tax=Pisum sativum TaxID=3888 RepID=UPI0021D034B9|nr:uncharacterized protein LOC127130456 [Pisum sativum]
MTCKRNGKYRSHLRNEMTLVQENKNILVTLKRKRPKNISNIKQVYNIQYQTNKALQENRTEMQQLLKLLDDNNYVSRYQTCKDGVTIRYIFWTHLDSIKLFIMFPTVLILDSTYKTNKYRLSLLEMVDVISIEKAYYVGLTLLESEKKESVTWALEVCRAMLKEQEKMHKVIVINRDTALINSVAKIFPTFYALLCRYHITNNVKSRVKPAMKEKIVCTWTDQIRHLRNTTTNRFEYAHAKLKNQLENSKHDLCRDCDSVNQMIQNQHNEIQILFGRSITIFEQRFKDNNLYSQLVGNISRASLNYIFHEAKLVANVGLDSAKCGCTIVKIYGLQCACVIAKKKKLCSPIRMDEVFTHLKRLRFDDNCVMKDGKSNISLTE